MAVLSESSIKTNFKPASYRSAYGIFLIHATFEIVRMFFCVERLRSAIKLEKHDIKLSTVTLKPPVLRSFVNVAKNCIPGRSICLNLTGRCVTNLGDFLFSMLKETTVVALPSCLFIGPV